MAKGWKCPHCSTENPATTLTCTGCGRIQGSVVVPGSAPVFPTPPIPPAPPAPIAPSDGWQTSSTPVGPAPPATPAPPAPGDTLATPSWAVSLDAVPPASTPLWRKLPVGWLLVGVLVFGGAIAGLLFNAGRSSTGEINRSGDMTANDLRVGDCFDLKEPDAEEISDVTAHPCTEAHEYEVFYVGAMLDGAYPGDEALTNFVVENCGPAFDAYVGRAYTDSQLDFSWLYPTLESWGEGDRSVQCAAYDPRETRLTISLKGSAQ